MSSYHAVNLRVVDQNQVPVVGVPVAIYTLDLQQRFAALVTNSEGLVETLLYAPRTYDARVMVLSGQTSRFQLDVRDTGPQEFVVRVPILVPGGSFDPDFCTVSEQFLTPGGQAASGTVVAKLVDGMVVAGNRSIVNSPLPGELDKYGWYIQELPRGARVLFSLPGMEPLVEVTIPHQPKARLMDLVAPYITEVQFLVDPPASISAGTLIELPFEMTRSDGKITQKGEAPLEAVVVGPVEATFREHTLLLTGQAVGSCLVSLKERHYRPLPDMARLNRNLPIKGGTLEIQVV